jgi:hypothetical protein
VDSHAKFGELKVQDFAIEFVPDAQEIAAFARICIHDLATTATQRIEQWVLQGHAIDDIFLKLIAPVARHLGWMWEEDQADFSQVSLGLIRLQQITHQLGYSNHRGPLSAGTVRRIMIGSAPTWITASAGSIYRCRIFSKGWLAGCGRDCGHRFRFASGSWQRVV